MLTNESRLNHPTVKPLNPYTRERLLATLRRNDINIDIRVRPRAKTYTIKDSKGLKLFSFDDAWGYGSYQIITIGNTIVAYANKHRPDIFGILQAILKKRAEIHIVKEGKHALSPEERRALKVLEWQR